ncbi:MAG: tyrosine-type recombinase/integrase [Oscillospiraceae bacterium]|nr:tyrosine-type recombinase/integrase [Oscillospiraceae bacterium]
MNDFFNAVRSFLLEYLPNQRCFSENTVRSYRQALNLFVLYLRTEQELTIKQIYFDVINRNVILSFLEWLETDRNCSANTRNQRLMVLRSFFDYTGTLDCTQMALSIIVQNIPVKTPQSKIVEYLSEPALEVLLKQPDPTKQTGLRNLFFMVLMYDTAARCGELLGMKVRDLRLKVQYPIAYLHGKGSKTRTVPLLSRTIQHCERYLRTFHANEPVDSEKPLFYTVIHGMQQPMSPDTVALFLKKYGKMASDACPEVPTHIHPHMLRHTRAMHLYHQGMPMMLLSEYLGHASEETTKVYAYADTEMKRVAIYKADIVRKGAPPSVPVWVDDDDIILKLSGLL